MDDRTQDEAEAEFDEDGVQIISRGRWTQGINGDITYYPSNIRPKLLVGEPYEGWQDRAPDLDLSRNAEDEDDPDPDPDLDPDPWDDPEAPARGDPRGGYRIRDETTWGRARADYLAGDSGPSICDRYDLSLGAFRARAARETWRRSDARDPEPAPFDPEPAPGADAAAPPDVDHMAADVLNRAQRAIARGRAAEAATWLRVHRQLTRMIPPPPPPPRPEPEPEPEPDPYVLIDRKMKAVAEVARACAAVDPDNDHAQAALGQLLAQLDSLPLVAPKPPVSDGSDDSDSGFSGPDDLEAPADG